jgi:DNA-directed RNA polymerase specialized sigma subunit
MSVDDERAAAVRSLRRAARARERLEAKRMEVDRQTRDAALAARAAGLRLVEISEVLGITHQYVSQIVTQAARS